MTRKFKVLLAILISIPILVGIGLAAWKLPIDLNEETNGDFISYTIINLDNISNSAPAFYYSNYGFYDETTNEYSYSTSFSIKINVTKKDDPYNISITLIDEDDFLESTTITSISENANGESGTNNIIIENINETKAIDIIYTISTNNENYSTIFQYLSLKNVWINLTVTSPSGNWAINKTIELTTNFQSIISVDLPTPHQTSFIYSGKQQYCIEDNSAYSSISNNTRTDAGTQTVTVSLKSGYQWSDGTTSSKTVNFTIEKLNIYINYTQEISSNSKVYSWDTFKEDISPQFKKTLDNSPVNLTSSEYTITGMNDGEYYYGSTVSGMKHYLQTINNVSTPIVMGSTYRVYLTVSNNYTLTSSLFYLKYKTVIVGQNRYTIEDALELSSGALITDANTLTSTSDGENGLLLASNTALITKFSNLDYYKQATNGIRTYTLKAGTEGLYVSYDATTTYDTTGSSDNFTGSVLYIPNTVELNTNSDIHVAGYYSSGKHQVTKRGVIFNNGTINLLKNLDSFGFIKGDGWIYANSQSIITEIIRFYSYLGGGPTLSMSNAQIFPLTSYSIHNISCNIKIPHDSIYRVKYYIDISVQTLNDYFIVLGDNGLFDLSSGYIIKKVEDTTSDFYSTSNKTNLAKYNLTNQENSQRDVLDIYGSFSDNIVAIYKTIDLLLLSFDAGMKTGPDYAMPIGFMNINLKDDGNGNIGSGLLTSNSYKFLPGSRLQIDENCDLTINNGLNVIFYDESYTDDTTYSSSNTIAYNKQHAAWYNSNRDDIGAQLIVNGSLYSAGSLGGIIKVSSLDATLKLSSTSATLKKMTELTYSSNDAVSIGTGGTTTTTTNDTVPAKGMLITNATISNNYVNLNINDYISNEINDVFGWQVYTPPVASISPSSGATDSGKAKTISLTGSLSSVNNVTAVSYYWECSDGGNFSSNNTKTTNLNLTANNTTTDAAVSVILTITASDGKTYKAYGNYTRKAKEEGCLCPDTLIIMANGEYKPVKDIVAGDLLLVFNHETGQYETSYVLFNDFEEEQLFEVINLSFSNGKTIKVISEHGFFDLDLMKYVYIDASNHQDYIGHTFYGIDGNYTLDESYLTYEIMKVYSPVTNKTLNYFTEGLLSMPGGINGLFNFFEYDDNLQYNEDDYNYWIENVGLLTYEEFLKLGFEVDIDTFNAYNAKYFKIAITKGILTEEDIMYYIERYGKYF